MSAIASPALALVRPRESATTTRPTPAPPRLVWIYGRKRYASERGVPWPTRLMSLARDAAARVWYDYLHQPRVSLDVKLALPDFRISCGSRAEARSRCRDADDYLYALPYGARGHGEEIAYNATFCRPEHPDYYTQDARDADLYTTDLSEQLRGEVAARLGELGDRLAALEARVLSALSDA